MPAVSEGDRLVRRRVEDERDTVTVHVAAEGPCLLDKRGGDLGGVGRRLEVVGSHQLRLRGDEGRAGDVEGGLEERERGELGRDAEGDDGWREGGGNRRVADVHPCGSRRDGRA